METLRVLSAEGTVNSKNHTLSLDKMFTIRPYRGSARSDRRSSVGFAQGSTRWRAFRHEHCVGTPSHGQYVVASPCSRRMRPLIVGVFIIQGLCATGFWQKRRFGI